MTAIFCFPVYIKCVGCCSGRCCADLITFSITLLPFIRFFFLQSTARHHTSVSCPSQRASTLKLLLAFVSRWMCVCVCVVCEFFYLLSKHITVCKLFVSSLDLINAPSFPPSFLNFSAEVFVTAYQALVLNAGLKDGDRVLIHAVSGLPCGVRWPCGEHVLRLQIPSSSHSHC